jgi:hypothetical protein
MDETTNGCHQKNFRESVVEAYWEVFDLPAGITKGEACLHRLSAWSVSSAKFSKMEAALLILRPVCRDTVKGVELEKGWN